jgi:DNA-damage-inducible protein D
MMIIPYDPFGSSELDELVDRVRSAERLFYSSDLARLLGYVNDSSFEEVVESAMRACAALQLQVSDHFAAILRASELGLFTDWSLSRVACYLIVMNADPSHSQVIKAQRYFLRKLI